MAIRDARESIEAACREADAIYEEPAFLDDPEMGWPALSSLINELYAVKATLASLPGEEMAEAIEAADKYLDDMADRADGQSY
jgi:hypothetical protein